jgi:hypothetical protein
LKTSDQESWFWTITMDVSEGSLELLPEPYPESFWFRSMSPDRHAEGFGQGLPHYRVETSSNPHLIFGSSLIDRCTSGQVDAFAVTSDPMNERHHKFQLQNCNHPTVTSGKRISDNMLGKSLITRGAGDEARTRDVHLGKVVLYQLSYTRSFERDNKVQSIVPRNLLIASECSKSLNPNGTFAASYDQTRYE